VKFDTKAIAELVDVPHMVLAGIMAWEVGGSDIGDCLKIDTDDLEQWGQVQSAIRNPTADDEQNSVPSRPPKQAGKKIGVLTLRLSISSSLGSLRGIVHEQRLTALDSGKGV